MILSSSSLLNLTSSAPASTAASNNLSSMSSDATSRSCDEGEGDDGDDDGVEADAGGFGSRVIRPFCSNKNETGDILALFEQIYKQKRSLLNDRDARV